MILWLLLLWPYPGRTVGPVPNVYRVPVRYSTFPFCGDYVRWFDA